MSQGLGLYTPFSSNSGPGPVVTPISGDPNSPYNAALSYLTQLVNEGLYGGETAAAVIDAFSNLKTYVEQMSPADTATVEATSEWTTLMSQESIITADSTQFDRNAAGQAASSLIPIVQRLAANPASATPATTFTPPGNSSFTPAVTSISSGSPNQPLRTQPAQGAQTATTQPIQSSGGGGAPLPNTGALTTTTPTVVQVPAPVGISVGAAVMIGLGALLLGGIVVYMFQPELLGIEKNPLPKKKRKKKRTR